MLHSQQIKAARVLLGLTQARLGQLAGVSTPRVHAIENGMIVSNPRPPQSTATAIRDVLESRGAVFSRDGGVRIAEKNEQFLIEPGHEPDAETLELAKMIIAAGRLAKSLWEASGSMVDSIFLRLSEKTALGADDLQWIVYRSRQKVPSPLDAPLVLGRGGEWVPMSFVRSTKEILMPCVGPVTCDEARVALAGYPDTFDAWKAAVATDPMEAERLIEAGKLMRDYMAKRALPSLQARPPWRRKQAPAVQISEAAE